MTTKSLHDQFRKLELPDWAGVYICLINSDSSVEFSHNADRALPIASIFKLVLGMELERRVEAGLLSWDQRLSPLDEETIELTITHGMSASAFDLRNCNVLSIAVSDNRCANSITDLLGGAEALVEIASEVYGVRMGAFRDFSDKSIPYNVCELKASPKVVVKIALAVEALPNNSFTRVAMKNCVSRTRLRANIPEYVDAFSKTGTLTALGVFADVCVLRKDECIVAMAFLSEQATSKFKAQSIMQEIGSIGLGLLQQG